MFQENHQLLPDGPWAYTHQESNLISYNINPDMKPTSFWSLNARNKQLSLLEPGETMHKVSAM